MQRLWIFLALLFLTTCVHPPPSSPIPKERDRSVIRRIDRATVTFTRSYGSWYMPTCAGVWLDQSLILTAMHCLPDVTDKSDDQLIGSEMRYKTYEEVLATPPDSAFPEEGHLATTRVVDRMNDLALLYSPTELQHSYVDVAPQGAIEGDYIHVVGHPHWKPYTYASGAIYAIETKEGVFHQGSIKMYQMSASFWYGSSGGGVFNSRGELLGVVSTMAPADPRFGWCAHTNSIKKLLASHRITLIR